MDITVIAPVSIITYKANVSEILTHKVDNDRLINLRNFLPVSFDDTEVSDFIGFFEDFLNYDLYSHSKDGAASLTDISILKKIELLFTLRDPDLIDSEFIQYFANQLGYTINYNRSDIADVTNDEIDQAVNGYLRETIRSLPHWYKFKSTDNAISMLLYSFGLVSDVLAQWTNDYENNWFSESPRFEDDLSSPSIPNGYYPTPHFRIVINHTKSPEGWENNLTNIINLIESIKPINTVFEGFSIKLQIKGINPGFDTVGIETTPVINRIKLGTETMLNTQTP